MSDPLSVPFPSLVQHSSSLASVSSGVVVHKNTNLVSQTQNVSTSSFVHNTSTATSTEISRQQVTIDEENSVVRSLGSLHEFNDGLKTIQPVITTTTESTVLSSVQSNSVFNLTMDGSISWNSDHASLYLSSNKAFRFKYVPSDGIAPSRLVLEGLDEESGLYKPKVEFSTD